MRWVWLFQILMLLAIPALAQVAHTTLQDMNPGDIPWSLWGLVVVFAAWGWATSSLPILAGLVGGTLKERYMIWRQILAGMSAGLLAFIIAKMGGQSNLLALMATYGGALLGDQFLSRVFPGMGRDPKC